MRKRTETFDMTPNTWFSNLVLLPFYIIGWNIVALDYWARKRSFVIKEKDYGKTSKY